MTIVAGPSLEIFYLSSNCSGRWHDSRVLKSTELWNHFENGNIPFPGAVIIGDSAYPCRPWLIPPFRGDVVGAKLRFNNAHAKTRSVVERTFGVLKKRFYTLKTGLRVMNITLASKLIQAAAILHNMCLESGDYGEDFQEDEQDQMGENFVQDFINEEIAENEQRRQELLRLFT